jgi:hypothetical protein
MISNGKRQATKFKEELGRECEVNLIIVDPGIDQNIHFHPRCTEAVKVLWGNTRAQNGSKIKEATCQSPTPHNKDRGHGNPFQGVIYG